MDLLYSWPTAYRYDVPFGTIDRPDTAHDVPALSFAAAVAADGPSAFLVTDTKYGYRGHEQALGVNLIRATYDPDPIPDFGDHHIRLGLGVADDAAPATLFAISDRFNYPVSAISVRRSAGRLPLTGSLFSLEGGARVYAVKVPEAGAGLVLRLADVGGEGASYTIRFPKAVAAAELLDVNENVLAAAAVDGGAVRGAIDPYAVVTLRVRFAE